MSIPLQMLFMLEIFQLNKFTTATLVQSNDSRIIAACAQLEYGRFGWVVHVFMYLCATANKNAIQFTLIIVLLFIEKISVYFHLNVFFRYFNLHLSICLALLYRNYNKLIIFMTNYRLSKIIINLTKNSKGKII